MGWYKTGTVSVDSGSTEVVGFGTSWIGTAAAGMGFLAPDGWLYEIAAVNSATSLTLARAYEGESAPASFYSLLPTQDYVRELAAEAASLVSQYSEAVNLWTKGEFDAGTVEDPGINFDGTSNGLFSPEENTVGLVTNGVERARVTSTGNLGIGTTTPAKKLDVRTGEDGNVAQFRAGGTRQVVIGASTTTPYINADNGSGMQLQVNGTPRLTITPTSLGLGTSSPNFQTQLHSTTNDCYLQFTSSLTGTTSTDGLVIGTGLAQDAIFLNRENSSMVFSTNNAEVARLTAAGNLGIGGVAPANGRTLAVQNSGTGSAVVYAQNSTTGYAANNGMTMQLSSSDGYLWNYGNGTMVFGTNNAEVARFTAAGNLAIGATSSAYPLYVYRAAADVAAMLASGTVGNATLYLNANGVSQNWLRTERATGDLVVATADTERSRFKYNGNFIIGGTSPTDYTGSGYKSIALNHTTGGILEFQAAGVQQARLTGWGGTFGVHTENVERLRVNSSGLVLQGTTRLGVGINPTSQIHAYSASGSTNVHAQSGGSTSGNFGQMVVSTPTNMWSMGTEGGTGRFFVYNGNAGRDQLKFGGGSTDSGISLEALGAGGIDFATGNATRLSIMPNGNVGIGGNPSNPLDVFRTTDGLGIRTRNTTSAREVSLGTTANSGYISSGNADLSFHRDGTEVMRLNGTNVGIGTTAPGAKLGISDGSTALAKIIPSSGTVQFVSRNYADNGFVSSIYSGQQHIFQVSGSEVSRFDVNGNMCIGKTTSLGYKVDIQGQIGVEDGTIRAGWGPGMFTAGTMGFGTTSLHRLTLGTNALARMAISGSGTVTIGRLEPASGGLFEVSGNVVCQPTTAAPTLGANGDMSFQRVSDTQLKVLMRGSDGTTRSVTLTLA